MKCSLGISHFLKRSLVFPILLFFSISLHWPLRKAFLSPLVILWNSAFKWVYLSFSPLPFTSILSTAICMVSSDNYLPFCISFSWGWSWSLSPVECHKPLFIVLQAHCLSDLIPWIYLSLPLYNCNDLLYIIPEWSSGFPYFLQFKSEFGNKEFMIWATVSSGSYFCWLYRASPTFAAKNIISLISVLTIWWRPHRVFFCVVGRGCLLLLVCSLGRTLLAFTLLHSVLQGQIFWLLQMFLDFLLLHSSPL